MPAGPSPERHEPSRREHAGLAHPAADHLARTTRPCDELGAAHDDRADRAGEALGEAEGGAVGLGQADRRAGVPQRDDGVEEARAVDVERHAVLVGKRRHVARVRGRERLAHAVRSACSRA